MQPKIGTGFVYPEKMAYICTLKRKNDALATPFFGEHTRRRALRIAVLADGPDSRWACGQLGRMVVSEENMIQ